MLVSQIDGNDMVNLHRIARHNASTIRAHVELSKSSGMIQDIPVSVILRPFILFPVISHGRQPNGPKDAPAEHGASGTLPADGPGISSRPRRFRCSAFPTHVPMRQIQVHASFPT